ncbi:hypothetical protein KCU85_g4316, partial [Aureobasidium melanogenum]
MGRPHLVQTQRPARPPFQHDEAHLPLTVPRRTQIRMPLPDDDPLFTALLVLEDDVPTNMINDYLQRVIKHSNVYNLWLADMDPQNLTEDDEDATIPQVNLTWQSPFVGKTSEEAFEYLATIPLKMALNREYLVVLDKALYKQKDWVIIYRIDEEGEITCIPCTAHMTLVYINSYL